MGILSRRKKVVKKAPGFVMNREADKRKRHDSALVKHGFIDPKAFSRMNPLQREEYYYSIKSRLLQKLPPAERGIASRMSLEDLLEYRKRTMEREERSFSNVEGRIRRANASERATRKHAEELERTGFKTRGLAPSRINRVYYEEKEAFADALTKNLPEKVRETAKEYYMGYNLNVLKEEFMKKKQKKKKEKSELELDLDKLFEEVDIDKLLKD